MPILMPGEIFEILKNSIFAIRFILIITHYVPPAIAQRDKTGSAQRSY